MATNKIVVLDPTSRGKLKETKVAKRPISLEGKTVGIIWNGKLGGDTLLERLGDLLTERFRLSQVFKHYAKADVTSGLAESIIDEFAKKCSFVLVGVGD